MEKGQLDNIKSWFDRYVAGFYVEGDDFLNANIELKQKHSHHVCDQIQYITCELGLNEQQKTISEAVAILHDVGRFRQFQEHRTYNDFRSVNHCRLGVEILRKHNVLAGLASEEIGWIEKAVLHHGDKQLPQGLNGDALLYCKLIRDADKIDIYRVVAEYYEQHRRDPDSFKLEIELPDEPWYSEHILQAVISGQRIDYKDLQTWNDCKLIQLSWVYDMNFVPTLKRVKQLGFLQKIIDFLPPTEDIKRAGQYVLNYVDARIEQQKKAD
ncbi:MAG: HD domain-containing protein [Phycisphaerales bacterium]|jgi:hypothetical protein